MTRPRPKARLHVADLPTAGGQVVLPADQAHHLRTVLRLGPGTPVALFNATSGEWLGTLDQVGKAAVTVTLTAHVRAAVPPALALHLLFAPLKKLQTDLIVEKATELGVSDLHPVFTDYSQTTRVNHERLSATIRDAAQQTERLDVPTLHPARPLAAVIADWPDEHPLLVAAEAGPAIPLGQVASRLTERTPGPRMLGLAIGPEAGYSNAELSTLATHPAVQLVSLGPRILRAETAALAALAVLQAILGDWSHNRPLSTFRRDSQSPSPTSPAESP